MNKLIALSELMQANLEGNRTMGFVQGGSVNRDQWHKRVEAWYQGAAAYSGSRVALYLSDTLEFSAALYGLWLANKVVCLPGNNLPQYVQELASTIEGFAGDFPVGVAATAIVKPITSGSGKRSVAKARLSQALPENIGCLEIYTSGTNGRPGSIIKTLAQLNNEVVELERYWGEKINGAVVCSTVSHQHIYGLLFKVLWPLSAGRTIDSQAIEYFEALLGKVQENKQFVLVSSPTHLSRLPAALDWGAIVGRCAAIFSSGAPLSLADSERANWRFQADVIEVYGSTETGGIAWRIQHLTQHQQWMLFDDVVAKQDNTNECLKLQSPRISNLAEGEWFESSDKVELLTGNCFKLLGRIDRIAKIEGKRIALDELEAYLLAHAWVDAVRVVVLEGRRKEIGAVVVLTSEAEKELKRLGRAALNKQLRSYLLNRFERPLAARKWRYIPQLPFNSQGKLISAELVDLFMNKVPCNRPTLPLELAKEDIPSGCKLSLHIPADLLYFDGHFKDAPILPGVIQIHWAIHFGRKYLSVDGIFSNLTKIKFQKVTRPGDLVELELQWDESKQKLLFSFNSTGSSHSNGGISFCRLAV